MFRRILEKIFMKLIKVNHKKTFTVIDLSKNEDISEPDLYPFNFDNDFSKSIEIPEELRIGNVCNKCGKVYCECPKFPTFDDIIL